MREVEQYTGEHFWGIFSQGKLLARYSSEQLATVNCIAMRRNGWGLVYVEALAV